MNDRDPLIVEWHRNLPASVPGVGALVATWDEIADLVEQARAEALDAATEAVALLLRSWGRVTDPEAEDMILATIAALRATP